MSRVIPFDQCKARPEQLLTDHLISVRQSIEYFFQGYAKPIKELIGLAGICHDLAKSNTKWQEYLHDEKIKKGPNHSSCGAFFFSYLGYHLLKELDEWEQYRLYWLWLTRDIADHHSKLKNLTDDEWLRQYDWDMFDLQGIELFIHQQYNLLHHKKINKEKLEEWIDEGLDALEEAQDALDLGFQEWKPLELMKELQRWRMLTTSLIAGDRFDVSTVKAQWLDHTSHGEKNQHIDAYCHQSRAHPLSAIRMDAQQDIMGQLAENPYEIFYTLDMPTGYGKTITALKMATWFGENQGYRKIVYVAPYLSILEQTSKVIEEVLKETVLEHHSLAVLDENQRIGITHLAMESWSHSVVCTSFQQFGKALFPKRSQDVLRRAFIKDSVIIIDEPQIFDPEVWNLFLCGLEALSSIINLKVIFLSATMPPFRYGLSKQPTSLLIKASPKHDRYQLQMEERKDESSLASFLQENEKESQAAILNTIEDAYRVYQELNADHRYLIHGLMTPLHKKVTVENIRRGLKQGQKAPLYVISTQVIEAGVDVSFQHIARALSVLPSIVQAAGRVNRHQEGKEKGRISVFPFYRHGEKDTRKYIYPRSLSKITDRLLSVKDSWGESELTDLNKAYYEEMFRQNTYEAALGAIREAYEGSWQKLSEFKPFNENYLKLPLFVPWDPAEEDYDCIPDNFKLLQKKFEVYTGEEVYVRYDDSQFMSKLTFEERKQFMILFHYYVLNLPVKKALDVASQDDFLNQRVPILFGTDAYDYKIGLKAPFEEYDNFI